MQCPKCNVETVREIVSKVEIDRCPRCRGLWLDALELEKLIEHPPRELLGQDRLFAASSDPGPRLKCPRCKEVPLIKLNSRLRPGTILDSCTVCFGNWLDAGELARLAGDDIHASIQMLFRG